MEEPRRFRKGAVSFRLGVVSLAAALLAVSLRVTWATRTGYSDEPWSLGEFSVFIIAGLACFSTAVVGLVLGIIGLREQGRDRRFAIAGTVISALFLIGYVVSLRARFFL